MQAERLKEARRGIGPGETLVLVERIAEVEPRAAATLRKDEEVGVALDADHLPLRRPAVGTLDKQPSEEMVGGVTMQRDARLLAHLRRAPVRTHDEPSRDAAPHALVLEADRPPTSLDRTDLKPVDTPKHAHTGLRGHLRKNLAHARVAETQRSRNVGNQATQVDRIQRISYGVTRVLVAAVPRHMVPSRLAQPIVKLEPLHFDDTPRSEPLASHLVPVLSLLLEQEDSETVARKNPGECTSTDAGSNNHHVEVSQSPSLALRGSRNVYQAVVLSKDSLLWTEQPLLPLRVSG